MEEKKPDAIDFYLDIRTKQYNNFINYQKIITLINQALVEEKPDKYFELQKKANQSIKQLEELEKTRLSLAKDLDNNKIPLPKSPKDEQIPILVKKIQAQLKKNQLLVQDKMATIGQEMGQFRKNKSIYSTKSIFNKIGKPSYIDFKQ